MLSKAHSTSISISGCALRATARARRKCSFRRSAFDPARPLQTGQEDGLNYRLYRINGDFKARYEVHDYPFDTQQLLLHFRNTQQRQELVTYVIDRFGLRLADERSSLVEDDAYSGLELWRF